MDNQQSLNSQKTENVQSSLVDIIHVLRAHFLIVIVITLLFALGGKLYADSRQPVYTASVPVTFDVQIMGKGEDKDVVDQVSSTNYLFTYLDTAVGICRSGEVLDRANVYYQFYKNSNKTLDNFIKDFNETYDTVRTARVEVPGYEVTSELQTQYRNTWFKPEITGTIYNSGSSDSVIVFKLWVTDLDRTTAIEKARIYTLAADVALNRKVKVDVGGSSTVGLLDLAGSSSGVSVGADGANRIMIIAAFIGLVLSFVLIYILYLMDNTLKSKEQLEEISGASVIAYIDDVAEAK